MSNFCVLNFKQFGWRNPMEIHIENDNRGDLRWSKEHYMLHLDWVYNNSFWDYTKFFLNYCSLLYLLPKNFIPTCLIKKILKNSTYKMATKVALGGEKCLICYIWIGIKTIYFEVTQKTLIIFIPHSILFLCTKLQPIWPKKSRENPGWRWQQRWVWVVHRLLFIMLQRMGFTFNYSWITLTSTSFLYFCEWLCRTRLL